MACGNGLRPDIWEDFKTRFQIPADFRVLRRHRRATSRCSTSKASPAPSAASRRIWRIDSARRWCGSTSRRDEPVRDEQGFCIRCAPNEIGEAIGEVLKDASNVGSRFEGYTNEEASEKKILRNVFKPGDAWFRTGDLMRKDDRGFFYFVDRIGDTFRWKGENVSTSEVAEAICEFPGVKQANVYGVAIPGADGRAGMAALVAEPELDLTSVSRALDPAAARLRASFVSAHPG